MPRDLNKRKNAEAGSGDETPPARQNKTRRTSSRNTVKFADAVQAVSFGHYQQPKSILKTRSEPFPTAPGSPDTAGSPSPEPSKQPEEEEFDAEEVDTMSKLATAAIQMAEDAHKERLEQELEAAQKELAVVKYDLQNVRYYEKILLQSRDKAARALADANKRTETAQAETKEALLAFSRLENKFKTMEGLLKRADAQVEKLQRELTVVREEKEVEKLAEKKTVMEAAKAGNGVAK